MTAFRELITGDKQVWGHTGPTLRAPLETPYASLMRKKDGSGFTIIVRNERGVVASVDVPDAPMSLMSGIVAGITGDVATMFSANRHLLTEDQRIEIAKRMIEGSGFALVQEGDGK